MIQWSSWPSIRNGSLMSSPRGWPNTGRGQAEKWFAFRLRDAAVQPTLAGRGDGEFRAWQWMSLDKLAAEAIWFRQPIYHILVDWLEEVDDPGLQSPDSS